MHGLPETAKQQLLRADSPRNALMDLVPAKPASSINTLMAMAIPLGRPKPSETLLSGAKRYGREIEAALAAVDKSMQRRAREEAERALQKLVAPQSTDAPDARFRPRTLDMPPPSLGPSPVVEVLNQQLAVQKDHLAAALRGVGDEKKQREAAERREDAAQRRFVIASLIALASLALNAWGYVKAYL